MKKSTKFISLLLAVLMAVSCFTGIAVFTASAADETVGEQRVYFQYPTDGSWGDASAVTVNASNKLANVYAYVYAIYGNKTEFKGMPWQQRSTQCRSEGNNIYSYDIAQLYKDEYRYGCVEEGADYGIIFSTANGKGYQTTDLTMTIDCIGDTVYVTETTPTRENSSDSEKKDFCAAWKNNPQCGVKANITSLGNVLEGIFPFYQPKAQQLSNSLKQYLTNSLNNKFFQYEKNMEICEKLGVTPQEVYDQYVSDNAEAIETGTVIKPDGVKDKTPVDYIEYQGYDSNGKIVTLKMATPYEVQKVLGIKDEPATTEPEETTVPETTVPETTVPETTVPETTVPETTVPETTVPETTVPETTVPETTVPETTVPETTVPETTVPEVTEDVYSIAGSSAAIFGSEWSAENTIAEMTKDGDVYTITFTDVQPEQNIGFKVLKNHSWDESWGVNGNNYVFNVDTASDVTITFNPATEEITVTGAGVSFPTFDPQVIRAVGNGEEAWLNGVSWDPADDSNAMTKLADGIYEITYEDIAAFNNYQVKFAADGEWTNNWGIAKDGSVELVLGEAVNAAFDGGNITFAVEEDGSTVKLQLDLRDFDFTSKEGAKFTITVEGPTYIYGDVNGDGVVTIEDATLIQKAGVELVQFDELQTALADVNGDGRVSVVDATYVQKYVAKFEKGYGVTGQIYVPAAESE